MTMLISKDHWKWFQSRTTICIQQTLKLYYENCVSAICKRFPDSKWKIIYFVSKCLNVLDGSGLNMLKSKKHVMSVHVFIYLVVCQSKQLYTPIARQSDSVNQDRASRPGRPGKGHSFQAQPKGQGFQERSPGQSLQALASRSGPPGQSFQAMRDGPRPHMKRSRPTHPFEEVEMCPLSDQI